MAYIIKLYDYTLDDTPYCIGSGTLTALELNWQLECAAGQDVEIHISSIGGSAFEAIGMYDAIKKYSGKKTTHINSLAASAASIVAMAGDQVFMSKFAMLMIHKPAVGSGGNADQLQNDINMLDVVQSRLAGIYMDKTGLDEVTINSLINATTWMTADQAKDLGFVDVIEEYNQEVTNMANIAPFAGSMPIVYKQVFNKLKIAQNAMKDTDKELIEKSNSLLNKVLNFLKSVTNKTVTNKGAINSLGPVAVGSKVTNEAGDDMEDGEYEVENAAGKKVKMTVKNSVVTNMEDDEVTNAADTDTEDDKAVKNVLNTHGLQVTNKVEAAGFAKVITNHVNTINTQNTLIADLKNQLEVSNAAVNRDETAIRETIKSEFQPSGSQRSNTGGTGSANDTFKPATALAQNAVKIAMNSAKKA